MVTLNERLAEWMAALEARQLADLTFQEVARALRALSSAYVERRGRLGEGIALSGAGKRAAFALYYGPLHLLLVHHIVSSLGGPFLEVDTIEDLGCGTGTSGAGWALACPRAPRLSGLDRHPWAVEEARSTCHDLGLRGTFAVADFLRESPRASGTARRSGPAPRRDRTGRGLLLAYAVNEVADAGARDALLARALDHAARGGRVIVLEPLAGFVAPWWSAWRAACEAAGGEAREWRLHASPVPIVEKLGRAAGLNYRELRGRTLTL